MTTSSKYRQRRALNAAIPVDTLESFHISRAEWLEVVTSEVSPDVFDILLRIDGAIKGHKVASEIAESYRSELGDLFDKTIERHQPAEAGPIPAPAAGPVQKTIEDNLLAALEALPLGRAEEDVRAAAFYVFRTTDPTEREIAEWQDAFDDVLHDLIREDLLAQRVVGGRVRILTAYNADNLPSGEGR